ncbi:MAG TPA: phospholipid carrier-dependent glycosyltransferase [Anaerolineae bacterium]|nr:phospholipid carrier-dependent glycosyltransferase [Anaerolineae bacterium]HQI84742.1 phospholipid carrier-dependent glycosyltransferase [Anaerolineae bacterium]
MPEMRKDLLVLLVTFIIVATAWNVLTPSYENLDEIEHAEVVRFIAATGQLPVHGAAQAAGYHVRQEASQPPLYHILAAGWARLWNLPDDPHTPQAVPGNVVECGPTGTFYNKATWVRAPGQEWRGSRLTLHALRFFSTLLQTATVAGVWVLARRIFRAGPAAWLATGLVAFNPQFLLVASGVNNDNAVTPLATWGLVLAFEVWDKGPTYRRMLLFGILSGLAGLSKLSGLGLISLGGLAALLHGWQHKTPLHRIVALGCWMALPALALVAPWMARNLRLYGDPTALAPMLAEVGRRTYPIAFSEIRPMLLSYWGQMPCSFYPRAVYWPYFLAMAGGLLGVIAGWRRFERRQKMALTLSAVWFAVIVLAWLRWNSITPATGGRLLFPAIAALALIMAAGWNPSHMLTRMWAAILPVWAVVSLCAGPVLLFAPPVGQSAASPIPNPTGVAFGDAILLRGYDVRVTKAHSACILASTDYCRPALDVTLYWQATQPVSENLTLALQLASPVPGETDLRLNYHHWPGRGNLPPSLWPVGTVIRDRYRLPLPQSATPVQAWMLQVALVDDQTGIRRPTYANGIPTGDTAHLTLLRIPDPQPVPQWERTLTTFVEFGTFAQLEDAYINRAGNNWRVSLYWRSDTPTPENYTVFVHAYAEDGELLATGDGPPQNGHFPTSLWGADDRILDIHLLSLPDGVTPARIAVGLYHPITGVRVPATINGNPLPDNAAIIWEAQP